METSDYHGKNTDYCTSEMMTIEIITVSNPVSKHIKFTGNIYSGPPGAVTAIFYSFVSLMFSQCMHCVKWRWGEAVNANIGNVR